MSTKKRRVLALVHVDHVPPETLAGLDEAKIAEIQTDWDVVTTLRKSGHDVRVLGVYDDMTPLRTALDDHAPDVVFNLLEDFAGQVLFDQNVVSYLELRAVPYTGCNPRGLAIGRDKALAKKVLHYHRIKTPGFAVFRRGRPVRPLKRATYPLIVKSLIADASEGIAQASIVHDADELVERVEFVHRHVKTDAIAETYVDGRELYVGVLGNDRLTVLPPREMTFENMPSGAYKIATRKAKWDTEYQERRGIFTMNALDLDAVAVAKLGRLSRRIYRLLDLSGYARMDFRLTPDGDPYLLEVNPNPNIAENEDFALSAAAAGLSYPDLLDKLMTLGIQRMKKIWSS